MGNDQSQKSQNESFKFFWRSDQYFWSFYYKYKPTWTPYDEGDNQFLEQQYQLYLKDPKTKTILGNPPRYRITFQDWNQAKVNDTQLNRLRPIIRELPGKIINIMRFNRFETNIRITNQQKINFMEEEKIEEKDGMVKIKFAIIKGKFIEIEVPETLYLFNDKKIDNYEKWIVSLKNQIDHLGEISDFQNNKNPYKYEDFFKNISKENFYPKMIKMHTKEGFLYKEFNKILRNGHKNELQNISMYYISLMASLKYYSQRSLEDLKKDGYMEKDSRQITVFTVGRNISKKEITSYETFEKNVNY